MPKTTIGLAELPEVPHFLYRLFDRTDTLLYIGITNDPKTRFKNHSKLKEWWQDVDPSKTRIDFHATRDAALTAEAKAIKVELPLYNDHHNPTVDTPLRKAIEAAKSKFAESLIKRIVGGQEDYDNILKDAAEQIEDAKSDPNSDWSPFSDDPAVYGAALAAERASGDVWHYKQAAELLLEALPIAQVERCRARAVADLVSDEYEPPASEVVCATAGYLVEELGDAYLDALDPEEARGWRKAARAMLHPRAPRHYVVQHAAAYAKAFKAERWY
ncbi:GIY-YIG nuclease family protein, partial [Paractinoplanes ferrugineus]